MLSLTKKTNKKIYGAELSLIFLTLVLLLFFLPTAKILAQQTDTNDNIENIVNTDTDPKELRYSARGLYNCEGAQYARVGLPGPTGPFVPVFAQATHSQTQLLTYKECVLDKIASHQARAVQAGLVQTYIKFVNDQDLIIKDYPEYLKKEGSYKAIKEFMKICPELNKDYPEICAQTAENMLKSINEPYDGLKCDVPKEKLEAFQNYTADPDTIYEIMFQPGCTPYGTYAESNWVLSKINNEKLMKAAYEAKDGFKPVKSKQKVKVLDLDKSRPGALVFKEEEKEIVVTPGSVVASQLNNTLSSGLRTVENADEIDEMVQTLLANLANRALDAQNYGVYGMSQNINSSPSYVARLAEQERNVAAQFRAYAGGSSLANMINNEKLFLEAKQSMVEHIINAIHNFRNYENACFEQKIVAGAKAAAEEAARNLACENYMPGSHSSNENSDGNLTNQNPFECPYTASSSVEKLANFLDITEKQEASSIEHGSLIFSGKAESGGNATLSIINQESLATSTSVTLSENWSVNLDSTEIPDGELEARITYPNGEEYKNSFYKKIIANIAVLTLPIDRYKLKITAQSQDKTYELSLLKTRKYSDLYTGKDGALTNLLIDTLQDVAETTKTLELLYKIAAEAQDNPELANWKVDQLIAQELIHTAEAVRQAQNEAANTQGRLEALVQDTVQDEWENNGQGWCNEDKWEEFKI